jgi:hypothetical protein
MVLDALSRERASGSQEQVSAQRVVAGVSTEAKTELVPSSQRKAAALSPTTPGGIVAAAKKGRTARRWLMVGVPLMAIAAVATFWLGRPALVFENRLVAPVRITAAGREQVVEAGQRLRTPLRRGRPFVAAWTLVRPTGSSGTPEGVEVSGSINVAQPRGRLVAEAHAAAGDGAFFAPLITNNTGQPLTVIVNAGLQAAMPCDCTVPPGAVRQMIGYYPLFRNSTVKVVAPGGRSATFSEDLVAGVDRLTGVVGLRFEVANLR